jgi:hypothetical protein
VGPATADDHSRTNISDAVLATVRDLAPPDGRENRSHPDAPVSIRFLLLFIFAEKMGLSCCQSYDIAFGMLVLGFRFNLHRMLNSVL